MRQEPCSLVSEEGGHEGGGGEAFCVCLCACVCMKETWGEVFGKMWKAVAFCEANLGRCVSVDAYIMLLFCSCGLCVCVYERVGEGAGLKYN